MKIKFKYYIPHFNENTICAAYFKAGKWRIYDNGAHYIIKNQKEVNELIDEVAMEEHVLRSKVKLVRPTYIHFDDVKLKE